MSSPKVKKKVISDGKGICVGLKIPPTGYGEMDRNRKEEGKCVKVPR